MSRYLITLRNVEKVYPPKQRALKDVSIDIKPGEFVFVSGVSGAGKSTLLKLLFGAEYPNRGDVVISGLNLVHATRDEIRTLRRHVGVVFQDYRLLKNEKVIDNVAFALELNGVLRATRYQLAYRMLSALGLGRKVDAYPYQLSGGEQQRIALARALMNRPAIVLADEPTGNLDPEMSRMVFDILEDINRAGATIVVASHDIEILRERNRRTLLLRDGAVVGDFATFTQAESS
jgi:cell division transport system ATP-binding protein